MEFWHKILGLFGGLSAGLGGIFGGEVQGGEKPSITAGNVLLRSEIQKSHFQEEVNENQLNETCHSPQLSKVQHIIRDCSEKK